MVPQSSSRRQGGQWSEVPSSPNFTRRHLIFDEVIHCNCCVIATHAQYSSATNALFAMHQGLLSLILVCLLKQLGDSILKPFEFLLNVHCIDVVYTDMKVCNTEASQLTLTNAEHYKSTVQHSVIYTATYTMI